MESSVNRHPQDPSYSRTVSMQSGDLAQPEVGHAGGLRPPIWSNWFRKTIARVPWYESTRLLMRMRIVWLLAPHPDQDDHIKDLVGQSVRRPGCARHSCRSRTRQTDASVAHV